MIRRRTVLTVLGTAAIAGCLDGGDGADEDNGADGDNGDEGGSDGGPSLESSAFDEGATIPVEHTCDGTDRSPPLRIRGVPDGAASLALVVDDPDAPSADPFVHWLLWNVPAGTTEVPAGIPAGETVDSLDGARQGTNDFDVVGYRGPCPPSGDGPHTYRFTVHVLDAELSVDPGADRATLESAIDDQAMGATTLTASYER